jgi:hypothetical protein
LAQVVASVASPNDWPAATLIRVTYANRVSSTAGKVASESSYPTRGLVTQTASAGTPPGSSMVRDEEATIDLLRAPLAAQGIAPAANDIIADADGVRWRVTSVSPDPVSAVWSCRVRAA